MRRSGFGGKQGSLSGRSKGIQTVVDRTGSKHKLIRAIAGADLLTWIDATTTSNTVDSNLTDATINTIAGTESTVGSNAPTTVLSSPLRTTAYSFSTNQTLEWATNLFPSSQTVATIATRFAIPGTLTDHIIFELGNASGYAAVNGGLVQGVLRNSSDSNKTSYWSGIGDGGSADTFFLGTRVTQDAATTMVSTYNTATNPDAITVSADGSTLPQAGTLDKNTTHNIIRTNKSYLGARNDGSAAPLNGHVSDFIIITRLLEPSQAARLSRALFTQ
jgi:hypothetical protein|tara:strand:+ start:28 stop:852 length:825 start_codon:yes stop_codon:yes gene_type:complete